MTGGSDQLPLTCFRLRDQRFTVQGLAEARPSTGRASCSCGTCPLIRQASPAADIDRSHTIAVSSPSTLSTHIGAVVCLVSRPARKACLGGIGRIHLLYLGAKSVCLVGKERRQLVEAPRILHTVVFAGGSPTTCACRALAYAMQVFDLDGTHAPLMGMVDDLSR